MPTTFEIVKTVEFRWNHHPAGEGWDGNGKPRPGYHVEKDVCRVSGKKAKLTCQASGDALRKDGCPVCMELAAGMCDICDLEPD